MDYEKKYNQLVSFIRGINASVEAAASVDIEMPCGDVVSEIMKEISKIEDKIKEKLNYTEGD